VLSFPVPSPARLFFCTLQTGEHKIRIYEEGGVPKGDAVLTYEDPNAAHKSTAEFTGEALPTPFTPSPDLVAPNPLPRLPPPPPQLQSPHLATQVQWPSQAAH
jgi:hypothetical protein